MRRRRGETECVGGLPSRESREGDAVGRELLADLDQSRGEVGDDDDVLAAVEVGAHLAAETAHAARFVEPRGRSEAAPAPEPVEDSHAPRMTRGEGELQGVLATTWLPGCTPLAKLAANVDRFQ